MFRWRSKRRLGFITRVGKKTNSNLDTISKLTFQTLDLCHCELALHSTFGIDTKIRFYEHTSFQFAGGKTSLLLPLKVQRFETKSYYFNSRVHDRIETFCCKTAVIRSAQLEDFSWFLRMET